MSLDDRLRRLEERAELRRWAGSEWESIHLALALVEMRASIPIWSEDGKADASQQAYLEEFRRVCDTGDLERARELAKVEPDSFLTPNPWWRESPVATNPSETGQGVSEAGETLCDPSDQGNASAGRIRDVESAPPGSGEGAEKLIDNPAATPRIPPETVPSPPRCCQ